VYIFVNKMNPVVLLMSIICIWYLKISSLPKLYYLMIVALFLELIRILHAHCPQPIAHRRIS